MRISQFYSAYWTNNNSRIPQYLIYNNYSTTRKLGMVAMVFISNSPHEDEWASSPATMTNQESPAGNTSVLTTPPW